jgi:hypothetical protein
MTTLWSASLLTRPSYWLGEYVRKPDPPSPLVEAFSLPVISFPVITTD